MKKSALIITALVLALTLASCGNQNTNTPDTSSPKAETVEPETDKPAETTPDTKKDDSTASEITPASIEKAIADAVGSENYLCDTDIEESWLKNSFGLDLSKVSAVNLDTVIILETEDGYADTAVELLNESYSGAVSYIRQYAFGVGKVMNARIYKEGNYVMYILAGANSEGNDA